MAGRVLARRQVRLAALQALQLLETTGAAKVVNSPGTLPVQTDKVPMVSLRVSQTNKEAISVATANFTSAVLLEVETRLTAESGEAAQNAVELLDAAVEQALLTNAAFVRLLQRISIEAETKIVSEARNHVAGTQMFVRCELVEVFNPITDAPDVLQPVAPPLEGMDVHVDLRDVFDPHGIYGDILFADAVQAPPRRAGPDGRDEGRISITFPT